MSAVTSRERRSTAGKRMSSLVGKAQEDDDAFWGHETWAEDDSGNDSFRESDEDSEARNDEFDSDFNDSESDHDAEEEAAGAEAEAELQRQERSLKRKQKFDVAKAGRDLMQKKKGKGKKRAMGDGINAGLVLNFPPMGAGAALAPAAAPVPSAPVAVKAKKAPQRRSSPRSPAGKKRSLRAATVSKSQQAASKRKATAATTSTTTTKKKQKRFTQEELLLEAATVTEPENERWLLARKRIQQTEDVLQKGSQEDKRGKVICKFRSRRGCLNSLTFPEMDHVPDILARKHVAPVKTKVPTECVITGKKARYRDPKTMLGYHDIAAFKELRRRFNAGEPLDQRKKAKKVDTDVPMLEAERNGGGDAGQAQNKASVAAGSSSMKADTSSASNKISQSDQKSKPSSKRPAAASGGAETSLQQKVAALKTAKPTPVAPRSSSTSRSSPRRRKPSARAMAAVETELMSPGNATTISNVILNMTVPQLDDTVGTSSSPAQGQLTVNEEAKGGDIAVGKEVLKSLAAASVSQSPATSGNAGKDASNQLPKNEATSQASRSTSRESMAQIALAMHNKFKDIDECNI